MSKGLFMLGSLLETHPGRAATPARMRTLVIVEARVPRERGGSTGGALVGMPIGPFAQQGLDEPFGLTVRLRR
jgi:hypothetical protein